MELNKISSKISITFSSDEFCLVNNKSNRPERETIYSLNYLFDRSDKGKDPDIGSPVLFLDEDDAKIFKEAGFLEVIL